MTSKISHLHLDRHLWMTLSGRCHLPSLMHLWNSRFPSKKVFWTSVRQSWKKPETVCPFFGNQSMSCGNRCRSWDTFILWSFWVTEIIIADCRGYNHLWSVISGKKIQNVLFSPWWRHTWPIFYDVICIYYYTSYPNYTSHEISHVTSSLYNNNWYYIVSTKDWNPGSAVRDLRK